MNKNQTNKNLAEPGKNHEAQTKAPEFTFDEWSKLYQVNPAAFESRRQAVLAIELAKYGPRAARARVSLANLEETLRGKSPDERARIATLWMADAAKRLNTQLEELSVKMQNLQSLTKEHLTR
jgi:hypothetical protein